MHTFNPLTPILEVLRGMQMELIKLMCSKIMQDKLIKNFSWTHERTILCFYKHRKLNLYKVSMIIDESKYKTQKILQDLIEMQVIEQQEKEFIMQNAFEALNNLIIYTKKQNNNNSLQMN